MLHRICRNSNGGAGRRYGLPALLLGVCSALAQTPPAQQLLPGVPGGKQITTPALPPDVESQLKQAQAQAAAVQASTEYVLRAGDELDIRCYAIPELNQTVRIRPDGKVSLVLLDDVEASGRTAEQLGESLSELYSKHFKTPHITAVVRNFYNFNVYVGGNVVHPGLVPLSGGLTAAAAVIQAGGLKDEESAKMLLVLRPSAQDSPTILRLNLEDVLTGGRADVPLRASDVLFVPKTSISVYVGGEVTEPGLMPLNGKLTVLTAVIKAHGFKNTASTRSVMLIREGDKGPEVRKLDLRHILARGDGDLDLKPFDVVYVPKSTIAKVDQFMDQYFRQVVPISMNMGFSYLLGQTFF